MADPASSSLKLGGKPLAEQIDPALHGISGPVNIAQLRSVNPMCQVFLDAAVEAGYPLTADFNGERQNGFGYYTFTQRGGERVTAEAAYLDPVRNRPNLTVLTGRKVTRTDMPIRAASGAQPTRFVVRRRSRCSANSTRAMVYGTSRFGIQRWWLTVKLATVPRPLTASQASSRD